MALFTCRDRLGNAIGSWEETILEDDLARCAQLIVENDNLDNLTVADRKIGAAAQLQGRWTDAALQLLNSNEAAPEVNQEVVSETFPDRYAHSVVYSTWAQRGDFINGLTENLDYDDQVKFQERLIRDQTSAIRALVGDVLDLQARLGEALQRIDNLEQWNRVGDANVHNLPGSSIIENPALFPLPPAPYYIGSDLISNETEAQYYHQGYHVGGVDGGLRRYYAAQESRGIPAPPISPLQIADESTGIFERFDQSELGPDGWEACRDGEGREGFGNTASCSSSGSGADPGDFPTPVTNVIPVFTTPFYLNQQFATGIAVVHPELQRIYPITLGNEFLLNGDGNEVYYNTVNPLCIPHMFPPNETDPTGARFQPKCFLASRQPDPFLPMPPQLGLDAPCGDDSETQPQTCPQPDGSIGLPPV
jgi:hypothetical protein